MIKQSVWRTFSVRARWCRPPSAKNQTRPRPRAKERRAKRARLVAWARNEKRRCCVTVFCAQSMLDRLGTSFHRATYIGPCTMWKHGLLLLVTLASMQTIVQGVMQSWYVQLSVARSKMSCTINHRNHFRSPLPSEFWVVSLQESALIEWPAASHSRQRPDALAAHRVTAVLPFSLSRIHVLPVLCATWHGPISIALYVPMNADSIHLPHHPLHGASLDAVEQHMRDVVEGLPGVCTVALS